MPGKKRNQKKKGGPKLPTPRNQNESQAESDVDTSKRSEGFTSEAENNTIDTPKSVKKGDTQDQSKLDQKLPTKKQEEEKVDELKEKKEKDNTESVFQFKPDDESIEVLDASPQGSPKIQNENSLEQEANFAQDGQQNVTESTADVSAVTNQASVEEEAKAKLFKELESQYVDAAKNAGEVNNDAQQSAKEVEATAQETVVPSDKPEGAVEASESLNKDQPVQDEKQNDQNLLEQKEAEKTLQKENESQNIEKKPDVVPDTKIEVNPEIKPEEIANVPEQANTEQKESTKKQKKAKEAAGQEVVTQPENQEAAQGSTEVKPKKKKKKQAQESQDPQPPYPPPRENEANQAQTDQQQSSWSGLGFGILSKASQNLSIIKENMNKQYSQQLQKQQEETEWKKWQSEMAKDKEMDAEKKERLEAKRLRKLQRERERQEKEEKEKQEKGQQVNEKAKAQDPVQANKKQEGLIMQDDLQMKKSVSSGVQNQNQIVDPLNPLAVPKKPENSATSSTNIPHKQQKKTINAAPDAPPTLKKSMSKEQPQSPSITESSQSKQDKMPAPLTAENLQRSGSFPQQQFSEGNYALQPPPDNSDMASSVSLNTAALYDNLESISQIGMSEQNTYSEIAGGGPLDLQNIGAEIAKRDKRIKELLDDRVRLKNLLKKAKTAIDSINSKYKKLMEHSQSVEMHHQQAMNNNKDLVQKLEIIQKQRNGIEKNDIKQILARIRCNDTSYTLIQNKNQECIWYQDTLILNIQDQMSEEFKQTKQVAYPGIFQQQEQTEQNLQQCMQQYEERLKRVNEYMEQSNSAYLKCQDELQQCRRKFAQDLQDRDNALTLLIEKSIDLKSIVMSIDEKASNQMLAVRSQSQQHKRKQQNLGDLIQDLEMQVTAMMNVRCGGSANPDGSMGSGRSADDQNVVEIRNHLIDLYQRIAVGLLKKHQQYVERLQTTEKGWQQTCDKLINEVQSLKEEKERQEIQMSEQIRIKTEQLNQLKTDHYKVVKANEETTEKLQTEINNSLNSHYLKNILTSYFTTNDASVQINLLKVVFKVMKFTEEEQQKISEAWNENNKTYMQKMFDFGY